MFLCHSVNNVAFYWISEREGSSNSCYSVCPCVRRYVGTFVASFSGKLYIYIYMYSDPAPFFANLFLFFHESRWLKPIINTNYEVARKFGNMFRFIDDLIAINDGNKFENHYSEIYPPKLILKKENTSHTETTFLDLHLYINEGQVQTFCYGKKNSCNLNVVRFPYKSSTMPPKMFFCNH